MLYIDNLDRYKDYLVIIKCGHASSGITDIIGIITDEEFSLPTVGTTQDSDLAMLSGLVSGGLQALGSRGGALVKEIVGKKFNTLIQSAQDWQGGSGLEFTVNFNVFKNGKGVGNSSSFKDFHSNLVKLTQSKTTNPIEAQQSHYDSLADRLTNPDVIKAKEANLFTVNIGGWFQADKLMPVATDFKMSTYVDTSGSPFFASVSISFKSYRNLSSTEWAGILRK